MKREWTTPGGDFPALYNDMLNQIHLLIAGAAGSGKSTVVNGLIYTALYHSPATAQFVLIDPKGTELDEYKHLPHVVQYAETPGDCITTLDNVMRITRTRFNNMKRKGLREFDGSHIYVIIDELMYLFNQSAVKRRAIALLQDILVIARAARVHIIACTQNPTTATIPATLRCNFDARLGLRTTTAQDSRNIMGFKGCECFPAPKRAGRALGYYMHDGDVELYDLPKVQDADRARMIDYWKGVRPKIRLFAR